MNDLTRDKILEAKDIDPPTPLEMPEWGGRIYIRVMTGTERDAWENSSIRVIGTGKKTQAITDFKNARAKLLAICICDKEGKRLFKDNDVLELGKKNSIALDRAFNVAQEINGITEEDLETIAGKSEATQSADSG